MLIQPKTTGTRVAGHYTIVDLDGKEINGDTRQCCHCGKHYPYDKHKGTTCMKCMKDTCGEERCDYCVPIEQWLDIEEKRRRELLQRLGLKT